MASANNNQTVPGTDTVIFNKEGGPCVKFLIGVHANSPNALLVNIPQLHLAGEFGRIPKGVAVEFEEEGPLNDNTQIEKVTVKGDGGNATIDYMVTKRTTPRP